MQSKATTVEQYLRELPADRREAIERVRGVILKNLPKGYAEGMSYGMIGYFVPHALYPPGYHCDPSKPLPFAGLASQKNHMSVYLMHLYADSVQEMDFRRAWEATGKKLDMGKCCVRFKRVEDVPLDVLGATIRAVGVKEYIAHYESSLGANRVAAAARKKAGASKKASATKKKSAAAKKKAAKGAPAKKAAATKKPASKKKAGSKRA